MERSQSRAHKCSPIFSRKGIINSEFAISISIFFIASKTVHPSMRSSSSWKPTVGLGSLERWITRRVLSISALFSLHCLYVSVCIHSLSSYFNSLFHPLSRASPLNLYATAYLARFLPVIDAHSIRLRTPVDLSDAVFVLNYFARRGTKKKGKREGGDGWYARDSLVFIRVAKLINFAWPRRAACLPLKLWKESSKERERERDSFLLTVSPIRHGYITVVKLTLRDACHVRDWSLTVLFQRTDSGEDSVRQNRFHGRNMNAHTCTRKLGMLLYVGDRVTEKNHASSLELGKSLLRGAMSSSYMQSLPYDYIHVTKLSHFSAEVGECCQNGWIFLVTVMS